MAKRKIFKVIGIVVAIGVVAGIAYSIYASKKNNDKTDNNIVLSISSTPPTMNPIYANSNSSLIVTDAIYEPLYSLNSKGEIDYNGIAKSITHSTDCKTYTVTLKNDLKWSDGKPLTANDVVFTFDAITNPKNNAVATQTFMINGKAITAKAINNTTVVFTLPAASLGFEGNLAQLYPIPEHIYKDVKDLKNAPENKNPIGDGPYMFKSEEAGSSVNLIRNPYFFGEKAKVENLVFRVIPNANSGVAALESGQLSAGYLSEQLLSNKKIADNYDVTQFGSGLVNSIVFNFNNKALSNIKVREAISYALNRDDLTKAEYGNSKYAVPAYSTFSPETQYYTNDVTKYDYNLEKAKEIMAQSGEKDVTLRLAYAAGFKWAQDQALVIQQELSQIGIKVELEPIALNSFFQEIFTPNSTKYDMAINGYNMGQTPDGYSTLFTKGGANNASNFNNPEITKLFEEAQSATSTSLRESLYKELQQKISDQIPVYTINYPETIIGVSKKIGGTEKAVPTPIAMFNNFGELYYKN